MRLIDGLVSLDLAQDTGPDAARSLASLGRAGICPGTGEGFLGTQTGIQPFHLLDAVGYGRIASAYGVGQEVAPIQLRSDAPYVLGGIIYTILPYNPAAAVARIASGTPFLMSLPQVVALVVMCLRHLGGLNAKCEAGDLPESARINLCDFLGMRLAADRATDRGLLLSRIDNAILSSLFSLHEPASPAAICEWIGDRIDEQHLPAAIEAAIGTLAWRGFVTRNPDHHYALTGHGEHALRAEASKIAALHADLTRISREAA